MSRLGELQRRFQDYLVRGDEAIKNDIVSTTDALAEHRLGAYYNAYRIRLIDILALDYKAVETHLGRVLFEELALDYLQKFPSTRPSIRWFGEHFPQYLGKHCERNDGEFIGELAQFEWTRGLIFDAASTAELFDVDAMTQVPQAAWPTLTIQFKPAIKWLDLHWNVCPYADAIDKGETAPVPYREEIPVRWLLWRKNRNPNWRSLEVHEAWAIEAAYQGGDFSEICEGLCEWVSADQVAITAAGFLKRWISDEIVTGVRY